MYVCKLAYITEETAKTGMNAVPHISSTLQLWLPISFYVRQTPTVNKFFSLYSYTHPGL